MIHVVGLMILVAAGQTGVPVVALAAVCDPPTWENDAVAAFFAGKQPTPDASPLAQAPLGVRTILVHGTADGVVPIEQSQSYADAAAAFSTGYVDLVAAREHLRKVNFSCPGESTVTFATGPCPYRALGEELHDDYAGSQLAASTAVKRTAAVVTSVSGS